jgi:hypothetical protein
MCGKLPFPTGNMTRKTIEKSDLLKVKKSQLYNMRSRIHKTLAEIDFVNAVESLSSPDLFYFHAPVPMAAAGTELVATVIFPAATGKNASAEVRKGEATLLAMHEVEQDNSYMIWSIKTSPLKKELLPGLPATLQFKIGDQLQSLNGWTTIDGLMVEFEQPGDDLYQAICLATKKNNVRIGIFL